MEDNKDEQTGDVFERTPRVYTEDDKDDPFPDIRGNCPVCNVSIHRNVMMCTTCAATGWYLGCVPMNERTRQIKARWSNCTLILTTEESKQE